MRDDFWIARAALLEPFDGNGVTAAHVARETGLSYGTVKTYAAKFGFDFAGRVSKKSQPNRYEQRRAAISELAAEGLTRQEVAERLGLATQTVGKIGRELGVEFRHGAVGLGVDRGRAEAMAAMYRGGKTLQEIGDLYGVTRERVRQIISKQAGITAEDGGQRAAAERKRAVAKAKKDAASLEKYGCTYDEYLSLMMAGKELRMAGFPASKTPTGAFVSQKNNALGRGIEWNLKLWDWWQVWQQSGKWDMRGRAKDAFVMCRFKDDGPYEIGNVYIATLAHNSSFQPNNPYRKGHPDYERAMAAKVARRHPIPSQAKERGAA